MGDANESLSNLTGEATGWRISSGHMRANPKCEGFYICGAPTHRQVKRDKRGSSPLPYTSQVHARDFEFIAELRPRFKSRERERACVNVPFKQPNGRAVLEGAVEKPIARVRMPGSRPGTLA